MPSFGMLRRVALHIVFIRSVRRLLATANVVPTSPIFVTLVKGALISSETTVLTRLTRSNIQEGAILRSHRRENLKSHKKRTFIAREIEGKHFIIHSSLNMLSCYFRDIYINSVRFRVTAFSNIFHKNNYL
jgi:hypothetical protein